MSVLNPLFIVLMAFSSVAFAGKEDEVPSAQNTCQSELRSFQMSGPHLEAIFAFERLLKQAKKATGRTSFTDVRYPEAVSLGVRTSAGIVSSWLEMGARVELLLRDLRHDLRSGVLPFPGVSGDIANARGERTQVWVPKGSSQIETHLDTTLAFMAAGEKTDTSKNRVIPRMGFSRFGLYTAAGIPVAWLAAYISTRATIYTEIAAMTLGLMVDSLRYFRDKRETSDDIKPKDQGELRRREMLDYLDRNSFLKENQIYSGLPMRVEVDGVPANQMQDTYFFVRHGAPQLFTVRRAHE